jgi:hypothetical protein
MSRQLRYFLMRIGCGVAICLILTVVRHWMHGHG